MQAVETLSVVPTMEMSEQQRLIAASQGDLETTARLLVAYTRHLTIRISRRIELNPVVTFQVEDVLQEVFIDVVRGIGSFQSEGTYSFPAWLNRICDRRLAQMLRDQAAVKRGRKVHHVSEAAGSLHGSIRQLTALLADERGDMPSAAAAREEISQAILSGIRNLPDDQQAAVRLHYMHGNSVDDTAEQMERTNGAVRGLLHRAKQSLRTALGNSSRWFVRK